MVKAFIQETLTTSKLDFDFCKINKDYSKSGIVSTACLPQSMFPERYGWILESIKNNIGKRRAVGRHSQELE